MTEIRKIFSEVSTPASKIIGKKNQSKAIKSTITAKAESINLDSVIPLVEQGTSIAIEPVIASTPIVEASLKSYFQQRMDELGISDLVNTITVEFDCFDDPTPRQVSVFSEEPNGDVGILYVGIAGLKTYLKRKKELPYKRLRLHPDRVREGMKYITPTGAGGQVFIPPPVLQAFHQGKKVSTLVVVEGEFKAFKLAMHGQPAIGLQGIGNSREKDLAGNNILNSEISRIIQVCRVNNIILLFDNDCLTVDFDVEKDPDKDLAKRPMSFFSAVKNFREACKPLNCDVYFSHLVKPDSSIKGIDDLLCSLAGSEGDIISDLLSFRQTSTYFKTQNMTANSLNTLKAYFFIDSANAFYEQYEDVIGKNRFRFLGCYYQHNGQEVEMLVSDEINNFIRVGDDYYERIVKPDRTKRLLPYLEKRRKSTITDDYTAKAIPFIKKYKAFCLVPCHTDYQEVIHNCYNAYHKITHQPQPGQIDYSLAMVKHIFGENHYEFGLDYMQLLYTKPDQLLPILLLQSKARNTGKSTFGEWLINIYGSNAAKLSNADLENDFNSTYAERLIIVVDETSISKKVTSEAIKKMSTEQGKIWVNAKGRQQYETDWIGKFIFCTNTENTSLFIGKGETRYFVRSIPKPNNDDPDMKFILMDEIPAFLHFLSQRTMHHPRRGRMYFDFSDYQTPELTGAIDANLSIVEKAIRQVVADTFALYTDEQDLHFSASDLMNETKDYGRYIDIGGIIKCLKEEFGFENPKQARYKYFSLKNGKITDEQSVAVQNCNGRPYHFTRKAYGYEGE